MNSEARGLCADEQLGVDEGTDGSEGERGDHPSMEKFERAVNIANPESEYPTDHQRPSSRDGNAGPRVATRRSVTCNDVKVATVREQVGEFSEIELQVGVAEKNQLASGGGQSRAQGRPIADVRSMLHGSDPRIASRPSIDEFSAAVA